MTEKLEKLIEAKVWPESTFYGDECDGYGVKVYPQDDGRLRIVVTQMYDPVDCGFNSLQKLAAVLGTQKVNVGENDEVRGCATCDYGSEYSVTFWAHDVDGKVLRG